MLLYESWLIVGCYIAISNVSRVHQWCATVVCYLESQLAAATSFIISLLSLLFCYCRCDSPILFAPFMLHTWWLLNQQRDYKLTCLCFVLEAGFPLSKIVHRVLERGRGSSTISALGRCYFFFFAVIAHIKSFHFDVGWSMWLSRCGRWKWWQPSFSLGTGGGHLLTVSMYFIAALELFLSFGFTPSLQPVFDIFL